MDIKDIYIIEIIKAGEIVINKGSKDGVEMNMQFIVFRTGKALSDPFTQESLGILEQPIALFRVVNIQDRISYLIFDSPLNRLTLSEDAVKLLLSQIKSGLRAKVLETRDFWS